MADIIDGKSYAAGLRERAGQQVAALKSQHDIAPGLAVVLVGDVDVDFDSVSKVAGAITPVPGGVGLMTIA